MILTLYAILIALGVILVVIGLVKQTESAQALVGFLFLFLLSIQMLTGNVEYQVGANTSTHYSYQNVSIPGVHEIFLNSTIETERIQYNSFNDSTSRTFGIYLAIASAVGFAGVFFSWRSHKNKKVED